MAADVLDPTNSQINDMLLDIRQQLREAFNSGKHGEWGGVVKYRPREFSELESGNRYKKRLTSVSQSR